MVCAAFTMYHGIWPSASSMPCSSLNRCRTRCCISFFSYRSPPYPPRCSASSWDRSKKITASGAGNPTSQPRHQSRSFSRVGLADEKATPECAYRSQTTFVQSSRRVFVRAGAASHRLALNKRWTARSSSSDLDCRYWLMRSPTMVVRSGKRIATVASPRPIRCLTSSDAWVVLPHRSTPSRTIKAPRFLAASVVIMVSFQSCSCSVVVL
mmetsp:Transcript_7343/g.21348  ORF Transcript_7343/g.21348 Transcript_7343/m.21348 type:complete len:210 (-) Transcript_7343:994-1623(-)